ncbi:MAG: hypothetical protein ACREDM_13925 [Methylocella sp.]
MGKRLGFLFGYRDDGRHALRRSTLSNDPVSQEDKTIVDARDMGIVQIQRQLQTVFKERPTFLAEGLGLRLCLFT